MCVCVCVRACVQVIQLFDSWAHHLSPDQFAEFSLPYANRIASALKAKYPHVPVIFHANGGGCQSPRANTAMHHAAPVQYHARMNTGAQLLCSIVHDWRPASIARSMLRVSGTHWLSVSC